MALMTRDDIIGGLRDVIEHLRAAGKPATIQIVGGAAIALTIDATRSATSDVDGPLTPENELAEVAAKVASARGWPADWLNSKAAFFLPSGFGPRGAEWETIYDQDSVLVQVGSPRMLLAMKLRAAERRLQRDAPDIAALLAATATRSVEAAEVLLSDYFPGDEMSERVYKLVEALCALGEEPPSPPEPPVLA
ncbi:hypothetical protein H9651_07485 [Microbacterium sp. Sa4CUA7]|uniref:Nucleotidyl transferase AbiEii/AbiGii toxin family protein n=1 Tax=Microbacterium pullorum TaxID=2762236 RepID=A0ABR8S1Y0_9MICO|nr:hypothetical protein [Microbacterium pullorum]MBD7957478.1 hypothetical protein [Microbacterium pullorum]